MADDDLGLDMEPLRDETPAESIRIILSLDRLGELVAAVAAKLCAVRGIEPPDFDGEEMRQVSVYAWQHCLFMGDREQFMASVKADLENLDDLPTAPKPEGWEHKPEFGL
jgi:hypothetical protein